MHPVLRALLVEMGGVGGPGRLADAAAGLAAAFKRFEDEGDRLLAEILVIAAAPRPLADRLRLMLRLLGSPDVPSSRQ